MGKDLAGSQKPLFGTLNIIPHPSPLLVLFDSFVKPKMASTESSLKFADCKAYLPAVVL